MVIKKTDLPQVANSIMNALHEDEIEIINELYQACQKGNVEKIDELMDLLLYDIEDHFSTEEELMREAEFFAYPMHKAEHDGMRKEVKALMESWKKNREAQEISNFIKDRLVPWLMLHIARWDSTTALHLGD
ncbi:MAG: hemerythrin family protein [Hydrogenobacter thermophilus]|uniref:bacteriohemerythrin n=1 Tax=Hydrogenobacter thermophilus TaxID=940 RepID=UPI001C77BC4F|nr:hemerythrin family protein [Hydrogenobacter thermophilus]QWK19103.1 MAG: hemerythrin family protein [Hydrogenobacter thermophilus]